MIIVNTYTNTNIHYSVWEYKGEYRKRREMKYKIKVYIWGLLGILLTIPIRTTIVAYDVRGVESPFLTSYFYHWDILLIVGFILALWTSQQFPFSSSKIVDKLWVTLFLGLGLYGMTTKYPLVSWILLIRIYMGISLAWYVFRLQKYSYGLLYMVQGVIVGLLGQSIIVIAQMIRQSSLSLPLVVEPVLSPLLAGVAKVTLGTDTIIRGYGTFSHPNLLSFVSLLALLSLYRRQLGKKWSIGLFILGVGIAGMIDHYLITSPQIWIITSIVGLYILYAKPIHISSWMFKSIALILHILIILTFSKSGLLLGIILDGIYLTSLKKSSMFHVEQFQKTLFSSTSRIVKGIVLGVIFIVATTPYNDIIATLIKRFVYVQDSLGIIGSHMWLGVGLGQYVAYIPDNNRALWQFEPVHNVILLLWSEMGLIGLFFLLGILSLECYDYVYGYKKQR